jgi:hypothetical protein
MDESTIGPVWKISIAGPGITADKDVGQAIALAVLQLLYGDTPPSPAVGSAPTGHTGASPLRVVRAGQPVSVREFLEETSGKTIHAKITAIGRFMRDHEGQPDFSREEVKNRFRSAGEVMPANFPRDFQKALQAGWIGEDPQNRDRFYVTRRGDDAIEQKFGSPPPSLPRSRRRRRSSTNEEGTGEDK